MTSTDAVPNTKEADIVAAPVATDATATSSDAPVTTTKKRGRVPGTGGGKARGTKGGPKATKPNAPKQPREEAELLLSISKPAARRFFKAVPGIAGMRLADNATDPIRRCVSRLIKRVVHSAVAQVIA